MVHYSVSFSNSIFFHLYELNKVKYKNVKFARYVIFVFYFIHVTTGIRTRDSGS
jgi:hypothetical protein